MNQWPGKRRSHMSLFTPRRRCRPASLALYEYLLQVTTSSFAETVKKQLLAMDVKGLSSCIVTRVTLQVLY